jgi:hypothetical protein|nr:MAG TPA: ATP-binding sugar transporter [Caudoviricetes sp.]
MSFKEMVFGDIDNVFLNLEEFADPHNLNGTDCVAILQDISVAESLSTGAGTTQTYPGIYGSRMQVNCKKSDLPEVPVTDQVFTIDGKVYLVESCADDMGMLTIQLVANER